MLEKLGEKIECPTNKKIKCESDDEIVSAHQKIKHESDDVTVAAHQKSKHESDNVTVAAHQKIKHESNDKIVAAHQPKVFVAPSIEDDAEFTIARNIVEQYYTMCYALNVKKEGNDHCLMFHSNKLCLLTLAPSHELFESSAKISSINYNISKNVNRSNNTSTGKGKKGAQHLQKNSKIFVIECENGENYPICSNVCGKLIEINPRIINDPRKILDMKKDIGYLAIILLDSMDVEKIKSDFLTQDQYDKIRNDRE